MGSLVIEVQYFKTFFYELQKKFQNNAERIFLVFKTDFLYHQNAHFILYTADLLFSSIYHYIFFLWLQRSIGQPKVIFLQVSKNHNKKTDNQKKKLINSLCPT